MSAVEFVLRGVRYAPARYHRCVIHICDDKTEIVTIAPAVPVGNRKIQSVLSHLVIGGSARKQT